MIKIVYIIVTDLTRPLRTYPNLPPTVLWGLEEGLSEAKGNGLIPFMLTAVAYAGCERQAGKHPKHWRFYGSSRSPALLLLKNRGYMPERAYEMGGVRARLGWNTLECDFAQSLSTVPTTISGQGSFMCLT